MSNRRLHESCRPWAWLIFDVGQKMNHRILVLAAVVVGSGIAAEMQVFLGPGEAERLARYLDYLAFPRLTEKKADMVLAAMRYCRPAGPSIGPHLKPGIHLYANLRAIESSGRGREGERLKV